MRPGTPGHRQSAPLIATGPKGMANVGDHEFDHRKSWHRLVSSFGPNTTLRLDDKSLRDVVALGERLHHARRLHHSEDDVDNRAVLILAPRQRMARASVGICGASDYLVRHTLDRRWIHAVSGGHLIEVGVSVIGHKGTVTRFRL